MVTGNEISSARSFGIDFFLMSIVIYCCCYLGDRYLGNIAYLIQAM